MRPDDKPTDARLFPIEANATADLDAKALDQIHAETLRLRRILETASLSQRRTAYAVFATNVEANLHHTGRVITYPIADGRTV